jgi:hypothetical protein
LVAGFTIRDAISFPSRFGGASLGTFFLGFLISRFLAFLFPIASIMAQFLKMINS